MEETDSFCCCPNTHCGVGSQLRGYTARQCVPQQQNIWNTKSYVHRSVLYIPKVLVIQKERLRKQICMKYSSFPVCHRGLKMVWIQGFILCPENVQQFQKCVWDRGKTQNTTEKAMICCTLEMHKWTVIVWSQATLSSCLFVSNPLLKRAANRRVKCVCRFFQFLTNSPEGNGQQIKFFSGYSTRRIQHSRKSPKTGFCIFFCLCWLKQRGSVD